MARRPPVTLPPYVHRSRLSSSRPQSPAGRKRLYASQSTGDIRPKNGYRWQLTPGTGRPPGGKLAQDGVIASDDNTTTLTVRFVAVCSLTVRLTVTSANGTTDTSGPVT